MIIDRSKQFLKSFNITNIRKFGVKFLFFKFIITYFDFYRVNGNFLNLKETLDYIKEINKSIIRLGDGEISLLLGKSILWQKYNYSLEQDLIELIKNYDKNSPYLLCLPTDFIQTTNKKLKKTNRLDIWLPLKIMYMSIFPKKNVYGNALLFRLMDYFSINLKFAYEDKNIIYVANEEVIELADLQTSKKFIKIIPKTQSNSYFEKDEIMNQIYSNMIQFEKTDVVILLSCGPLAKVLAYEISNLGYRALDLGYMFEMPNIERKEEKKKIYIGKYIDFLKK